MLNARYGPLITAVGLAGLLYSVGTQYAPGVWIFKPLASAGFLVTASPGFDTIYGKTLFGSLVLCYLGDVLLIPGAFNGFFQAGLVAFLLGHVGFGMTFAQRDVDPGITVRAAAAQAAFGGFVWRWISPFLPADDVVPVAVYITVISCMGATAIGSARGWRDGSKRWTQIVGAILFELSDLCVAREQFVEKTIWNPAIGLPLYYVAQTLLATLVW